MRVALVGAGAMGTLMGHGLCRGGHEVTMLDLPPRVAQLRQTGRLTVISDDGTESVAVPQLITSDYSEAGRHEVIILACKSQDLPAAARDIGSLAEGGSVIVTIQNGIPWWYPQTLPEYPGPRWIRCLDPERQLERYIDPSRIIGCVAYPAAILEPDGRVRHVEGYRFPVGELDGEVRERTRRLSMLFEEGGFKSRIIDDIGSEIWLKAWGALSINPISALTHATMEEICSFPETRGLIAQMMTEAQSVAEAFGAKFRHTIDKRIEGAKAVGAHKTSMLQDVENGIELELDALMRAVLELAELAEIATPAIRHVYACTALLNSRLISQAAPRH